MSFLRRRLFGDDAAAQSHDSRTPSPAVIDRRRKGSNVTIPAAKLEALNAHATKKPRGGGKRRNAWIFGLGGLFGLVVAGFFAQSRDMIDLSHLADVNLDSLADILPAGLMHEARAIQVNHPHDLDHVLQEKPRPCAPPSASPITLTDAVLLRSSSSKRCTHVYFPWVRFLENRA